jgi:hypothetical protein
MTLTYTPNPKNQAFIRRANLAIKFVDRYVSSTPRPLSQRFIEDPRHFGSHRNELSRWLKAELLECVDVTYNMNTGRCKRYVRRSQGYERVVALLNVNINTLLTPDEQLQLATGHFDYEDKSERSYTWLQFYPKPKRNSILNNNGYLYHYDIEAAAPTLLLQQAKMLNPTLKVPNLEYYVGNRDLIRRKIAQACHISELQVKNTINSILQGGIVSSWNTNKTFNEILNSNYSAVYALNTNADIIAIKQDITRLWKSLKQDITTTPKRLRARDKAKYYRELEQAVGKTIKRLLKKHSVRWLWIHDGWACDKAVDPTEIVRVVKRATGFDIKLDWTKYED